MLEMVRMLVDLTRFKLIIFDRRDRMARLRLVLLQQLGFCLRLCSFGCNLLKRDHTPTVPLCHGVPNSRV